MDLEFIAKLYAANKHACLFPALKLVWNIYFGTNNKCIGWDSY